VLASSADNTIRELFVGTRSDMRWLSPYSNPARLSLDSAARLPSELCTLKLWRMRLLAGGRSVGSGCGVTLPAAPAAGVARAAGQAEGELHVEHFSACSMNMAVPLYVETSVSKGSLTC
jgi:hypothetical protein